MGAVHVDAGLRQPLPQGALMSLSIVETFLRNAREQHSQQDINSSLLKAVGELTREIKRLDDEIRRVRRDVQMSRRF
jgi:hypothetical protein